jgi:hypothetical protein
MMTSGGARKRLSLSVTAGRIDTHHQSSRKICESAVSAYTLKVRHRKQHMRSSTQPEVRRDEADARAPRPVYDSFCMERTG